jgi:hypothetical protein
MDLDPLLLPWLTELGLITYRDFSAHKRPPLPSEVLSTFVVFGMFTLVSAADKRLAMALGWGVVVATVLNVFPGAKKPTPAAAATGPAPGPTKVPPGTGPLPPGGLLGP